MEQGAPPALASLSDRLLNALRHPTVQLALVLASAFLLRLVWVLATRWEPQFDDDAYRYEFTARALANGAGYVHIDGYPTAFWPPGYSLLIATLYVAFGEHVFAAQMLNVVLGTATVGLVYLLGRRLAGHATAMAAAGLVAFWPSLIFFTGVTLSETAFTFLALLGVYLIMSEAGAKHRVPLLVLTGLVFGFAALVRGQALLLPLVLVPYWLCLGVRWPRIAGTLGIIAIGMAAMVLPWTVRNVIELDSAVLISTNAGVDFWIGHHEHAGGDFGSTGGDALVFRYPELDPVEREVRVNEEGFREGIRYAVTHPAAELILPAKKFFWLYYNDEEGLKWNEGHSAQRFLPGAVRPVLYAISNVYYFTVLALLAVGFQRWFSLREPGHLLLISLAAYWTLVHLVFFGDARFHAPIMPVVALLVALAWFPSARSETIAVD